MNAKDYMLQLVRYDNMIQRKIEESARYKDIAMSVPSMNFSGVKSSRNVNDNNFGVYVDKYVDIDSEIAADIANMIEKQREILRVIEQLDVREYDLLHKRYFQRMSLTEIAADIDRSYSCVTTLHCRALNHLQIILDNMP